MEWKDLQKLRHFAGQRSLTQIGMVEIYIRVPAEDTATRFELYPQEFQELMSMDRVGREVSEVLTKANKP